MISLTWSEMKVLILYLGLSPEWVVAGTNYVCVIGGSHLTAQAIIPITSPASEDQIDFETNYKI